jgi:hypothetical protein
MFIKLFWICFYQYTDSIHYFCTSTACIYFRTVYTWYCTCGNVYYWSLSRVCIYYKYAFHWWMIFLYLYIGIAWPTEHPVGYTMDLWIEFYFAMSEKWAVGVMGCRSNGLSVSERSTRKTKWRKIAIRMEARRVKNWRRTYIVEKERKGAQCTCRRMEKAPKIGRQFPCSGSFTCTFNAH